METTKTTVSPLAFDAMFNLAVDCYEKGDVRGALEMFQVLSLVNPSDEGVWAAMARCHEDLDEGAVAVFLRSLSGEIQALARAS